MVKCCVSSAVRFELLNSSRVLAVLLQETTVATRGDLGDKGNRGEMSDHNGLCNLATLAT